MPATTAADPATTRPRPAPEPGGRFYRVVWRWHFYAGLIVAPVLLIASLTGAALVFERELKQSLWPQRYVAGSSGEVKLPLRTQIAAARAAAAGAGTGGELRLAGISIGELPRSTTVATFDRPGGGEGEIAVAVDPYAGVVQAVFDEDDDPFHTLLDLHRTLLAGTVGRHVVELATGWTTVLIVSGVYLWWPRKSNAGNSGSNGSNGTGRRVRGTILPRVRAPAYTVLRDLHAIPGALAAVPLLIIFAGGLVFSATNGGILQWHMARTGTMPAVFRDPPKSTPIPGLPPDAALANALDGVDRALAMYQRPGWGLESSAPATPDASFGLFIVRHADGPVDFDGVAVDQYTGAHLDHFSHVNAAPSFDLMRYGYALHTGSILGTPTKILAVAVCLALAAATITGVAMWWTRRPPARLGLPARSTAPTRTPRAAVWTITGLGVLIPALGASILLILLAEAAARRRGRAGA